MHARLGYHQALLRPLHPGHRGRRLRAAGPARSSARSTSSRCCGELAAAALAGRRPTRRSCPPAAARGGRPGSGFAAMAAGTGARAGWRAFPLLPVALRRWPTARLGQLALLVLILVQDAALRGHRRGLRLAARHAAAVALRPARHARCGARAGIAVAAPAGARVRGRVRRAGRSGRRGTDELGTDEGVVAAIAFSLAAIVVAPVAEELFFRAFFYRALRNRLRVWSACLINALVFASLHVQYLVAPEDLRDHRRLRGRAPACVYEVTGSVFAADRHARRPSTRSPPPAPTPATWCPSPSGCRWWPRASWCPLRARPGALALPAAGRAHEPRPRGARARAPLAHALRGGLRHLALRRGVAVGGGGHRLPAAARAARARPGRPSRSG